MSLGKKVLLALLITIFAPFRLFALQSCEFSRLASTSHDNQILSSTIYRQPIFRISLPAGLSVQARTDTDIRVFEWSSSSLQIKALYGWYPTSFSDTSIYTESTLCVTDVNNYRVKVLMARTTDGKHVLGVHWPKIDDSRNKFTILAYTSAAKQLAAIWKSIGSLQFRGDTSKFQLDAVRRLPNNEVEATIIDDLGEKIVVQINDTVGRDFAKVREISLEQVVLERWVLPRNTDSWSVEYTAISKEGAKQIWSEK